jgi:hypothetical protein
MSMRVPEHSFSDLLRRPNEVVKDLANRDVLLRRRDAPALRLGFADRDQDRSDAYAMVGRTLRNLAVAQPHAVAEAVADEFPWTSFLPEDDRAEFVREFTLILTASGDVDNFTALGQLLHEWQATAEVRSDPRLAARLARPVAAEGDVVPAPAS